MTGKIIFCEECGEYKEHHAKDMCKDCYINRFHYSRDTCRILDAHHNDLIDDNQRFSSQYILDMCKGVKSNWGVKNDR